MRVENPLLERENSRRRENSLLEESVQLLAGELASVLKLAPLDVLGEGAQLGGLRESELGVALVNIAVEEAQDDLVAVLGELAGGQVADEAAHALLGLALGDQLNGEVLVVGRAASTTEATAAAAGGGEAQDGGALESGEAEAGGESGAAHDEGGAGQADGREDGVAEVDEGQSGGNSEEDLGVHPA